MRLTVKISKILEQGLLLIILVLVFLYDVFVGALGFLDEFVGLLSLLTLIFFITVKGKIKLFRNEYYIVLLLGVIMIIGLLSNFFAYRNGYKTEGVAIIGDFIVFYKAFMAYIAIRLLSYSFDANRVLKKVSKYTKLIFYLLVIFIIIDFIFKIYPHQPRYGIYSIELFFKHPSRYAFSFAFIFLVLLPEHYKNNKSLLYAVLFFGLLSLRVKYFGFVVLAIFFMFYGKRLFTIPKIYFLSTISSIGLIIVWLFWNQLDMYFSFDSIEDAWSRAVILYYSFIIGNDFFPLGSGFGTYSSYFSGLYYSWVYDLYGINNVYGISKTYWSFIADQYWPMVLGQFGYLGLLSMAFVIYHYLTLFIKNIKANINNTKYYYFLSAILGLMLLLINSTADAIFTQQRAVVMFVYFALVINTTTKKYEK